MGFTDTESGLPLEFWIWPTAFNVNALGEMVAVTLCCWGIPHDAETGLHSGVPRRCRALGGARGDDPATILGCTAYHWVWLMRTENLDKALAMLVPSNWSIL